MKNLFPTLVMIATGFFLALVVVLLFLAPEVDPLRSGISFYALTNYDFLVTVALVLIGLSGIFLAVPLWKDTRSTAGRIGLVLLMAWGITSILAGIFPLDAPGASPTRSGSIHNMAGLNFLLIAPAVLLIERAHASAMDTARPRMNTSWLAWLVLLAAVLLFIFNGPLASLGMGGLIQRLYWLILVFWLFFKAQSLLQTSRKFSVA